MAKFGLWTIVTTITGSIGWYLGSLVGGLMTSWMAAVVGTAIGAWYTRQWIRDNLS
jgi:hypothetical protein